MQTVGPHASISFDQIEAEGPATRPLDFPPPKVRRGVRVNALVVHPTTGQRDILPGVIHRESYTNGGGGGGDDDGINTGGSSSLEHSKDPLQIHVRDSGKKGSNNKSSNGSGIGKGGANDKISSSSKSKDAKHVHSSSQQNSLRNNNNKSSSSSSSRQQQHQQQQQAQNQQQRENKSPLETTNNTSSPSSSSSTNPNSNSPSSNPIESRQDDYIAYFPQRRLQDAIYGSVWACLVLKRHYGPAADDAARAAGVRPGDPNAPIVWEIVGRHVAIKMIEWSKVHQSRGRLLEDPVKEIAAMQLIGTEHKNVLGSMEVLQDDDFLFSIMPYARGGDLFGYVVRDTELRGGEGGMSEPVARYWFRQLLDVSLNKLEALFFRYSVKREQKE